MKMTRSTSSNKTLALPLFLSPSLPLSQLDEPEELDDLDDLVELLDR